MADNNIFLSKYALKDLSEGGAYVHNLFAGKIKTQPSVRYTPYHFAHATGVAGLLNILSGDDRFYNNIFVGMGEILKIDYEALQKIGYGLAVYDSLKRPMYVEGNVYLNKAIPFNKESLFIEESEFDPNIKLVSTDSDLYLHLNLPASFSELKTQVVTSERLGIAVIPDLPFENRDGSAIKVDYDYFGKKRSENNPTAGPFEDPGSGELKFPVWKRN
jgi:hypothetical protein